MKKIKLKNKNIYFLLLTVSFLIIILLVGSSCSKTSNKTTGQTGNNTISPQSESNTDTTLAEAKSKKSISIWDSCQPKERIFLMESINNFTKLNPKLSINTKHFRSEEELVDVFSASSLAGAGPEIVLVGFDSMKKLAQKYIVKDLSDEINYNIFLPGLVELSSFDGKKYIIPFSSSDFLILYYNKDLIKEIPSNFDGVVALSKEYLNSKDQKYGFLFNGAEPDWVVPFIGGYLDWFYEYDSGSINLNSSAMEKTLNFINNVYNIDKILPANIGYEDMNNIFKSGKAAMFINGVWAVNEYKEAGLNFGVAKIPRNTDGVTNPTPMISGLGFMVNNNSSGNSFEIAKKFIEYMVSPDTQTSWTLNTSSYPAIVDLERDKLSNDDIIYNILLQAKICRGKPPEEDLRLIRDVMRLNIESIISGNISPADAKEKMQEDIIKLKSGEIKVEDYSTTTSLSKNQNTSGKGSATTTTK